jgi:DNA-binding CsgD family transcriptional regulator
LQLPRARALAATGAFGEAREALLEALRDVPPDATALRVQLAATAARVEHLLGMHEQAHGRLVAALEDLPDGASEEALSLMVELTMDGQHRMDYKAMEAWAVRTAEMARALDDPVLVALGIAAAARGFAFAGAIAAGEAHAAEAAERAAALSDAEIARRLDTLTHLAGAHLYLHQMQATEATAQRALSVGRATGQGQQFPLLFAILGMCWSNLGRLQDALEPLEAALEAARTSGNAQTLAWTLYGRATIALWLGDLETALSAAQEAVDLTQDGKPSHHRAYSSYALAEATLQIGKPERALTLLSEAGGGEALPLYADSFRAFGLECLVRCHLAVGNVAAAAAAAAVAEANAGALGLPLAHSWAGRARAEVELHAGDADRAAETARVAVAAAEQAALPLPAAVARIVLGQALARAGDEGAAATELEAAAGEFNRVGALRYRDAAERELRALGRRISRRTEAGGEESGVGSLTRRELEIARLIVDRRTNRQIAEELFLSPKTVETHVRNIFAKLGVDSRVEVARAVERSDRAAA